MKMRLNTALLTGLLVMCSLAAQSQHIPTYWVTETNRYVKGTTVRLYDEWNQVVHEVRLEKKTVDIARRRDRRMLDNLLKAYTAQHVAGKRHRSRSSI